MRTTKTTMLTTALALVLAIPGAALAKGPHGGGLGLGRGDGRDDGRDAAFEQLDLTDSQRARLEALRKEAREERVERRIAMLEVLTPQQRAQLRELQEERIGGRGERPGRGAGTEGWRGKGPGAGRGDRMALELDLSDEQREQAQALRQAHQASMEPLRERMGALRDELEALWAADRPSKAAILAKMDEIDALREQLRQVREANRASLGSLLTPDRTR
jgi:Spy/CpxP family protein refolding chaperone